MVNLAGYNKRQLVRAARALSWTGDQARISREELERWLKGRDPGEIARALAMPPDHGDEAAARLGADGSEDTQKEHEESIFPVPQLASAGQQPPYVPRGGHRLLSEIEARNAAIRWTPPELREQEPQLVALDLRELLARQFTPAEAILPPWLRRQTLAMVHAIRGVGKTHFALGVAYAVATGGTFLGWKAAKPLRVLYIDGEMPGSMMQERLQAIVQAGGEKYEDGFLRIITPDAQPFGLPDLSTQAGQEAFNALIGDADLIIVDNLSALARSGPENEGESWLPLADWALALRRQGRAVLFVHHSGKNGTQRGSSRREDLLDVVINLRQPSDYKQDGAHFELRFEKSRGFYGADARPIEARLTKKEDDGLEMWTWKDADSANYARMMQLAKEGMSMTDIALELKVNKSTVSRALKKAREAGDLAVKEVPHG